MKPDWNDAPEWANYTAMDADGDWYWFANEPVTGNQLWSPANGQCELAETVRVDWRVTLEPRP